MTSHDLRQINLNNLVRQFGSQAPIFAARRLLSTLPADQLAVVLRDYRVSAITDPAEIEHRDSVDELLAYYSLLELASIVQFVPNPLPEPMVTEIAVELNLPAVRVYYEDFYPLILPQSLRLRLAGERDLVEPDERGGAPAFLEFLGLVNEFERDRDTSRFVRFMDDYRIGGVSWVNLRDQLRDPMTYAAALSAEPDQQTIVHSGVHGFRKFLEFAATFESFLDRLSQTPLFRSGCWHYFAYWFDHVEDRLGPVLQEVLQNTLTQMLIEAGDDARQQVRQAAQAQREQLDRLFNSPYAADLRRYVDD